MAPLKTAKDILVPFFLSQLRSRPARVTDTGGAHKPMVFGLQGPQGIGKTWVSKAVKDELEQLHDIRTLVISLDDLYLPRGAQQKLEEEEGGWNRMLRGRGLPGTHDLELGVQVFESLSRINETKELRWPIYDKSAHGGLGDRAGFSSLVLPPDQRLQLVIFEGWMLGFTPLDPRQLTNIYHRSLNLDPPSNSFLTQFSIQELQAINRNLVPYVDQLWSHIHLLIHLVPQDLNFIWRWRIQQEHEMKAKNGGIGMSDEEVKRFIFRYMPCYELYGKPSGEACGDQAIRPGLKIVMDEERRVVDVHPPTYATDHVGTSLP